MDVRSERRIDSWLGRAGIAILRPLTIMLGRVLRRDHALAPRGDVVFVKLLGGGSLLTAMPMLLGFRRAYPRVRMALITTPAVQPFAELMGPGLFDEVRMIDNSGPMALVRSALRVLGQTMRVDCVVDLEVHSRLTTVFATLTMARNRVGFWLESIYWRRGLASHLIFFNRGSPNYAFYDRVADLFGFPIADRDTCLAALLTACGLSQPRSRARVCVGFACSELGQERMLTPEQWKRVFRDNLRAEHREFVLLGSRADRARGDAIARAVRAAFPRLTIENRCGELSLRDSAALLLESAEFWGIDSSLLHLARLGGLRTLSYWGPTDPATRLRPSWRHETETVMYRKIACSPCVHTSEDPPCRGDNRCIQGLFEPERVPIGWTPIEYPGRT